MASSILEELLTRVVESTTYDNDNEQPKTPEEEEGPPAPEDDQGLEDDQAQESEQAPESKQAPEEEKDPEEEKAPPPTEDVQTQEQENEQVHIMIICNKLL